MSIEYIKSIIISQSQCTNQKVEDFLAAATSVYGESKVKDVCIRYNLFQSETNNVFLKLQHVRQLQVGLNDINISDLESFLKKIKEGQGFTNKEESACAKLGDDKLSQLKTYPTATKLPPNLFNDFLTAFKEPNTDYRGTTFTEPLDLAEISGIPGKLFSVQYWLSGWLSHSLGRSLEDEERLCICEELESLQPHEHQRYCEIITKILVKKHLYYEQKGTHQLRMGMLVPALKGENGEPRWYIVSDMIDSGLGKFGYRLVPATQEYSADMPDLILFRSSASLPTAMDSFTSYLSDLNILPPGYLGRNRCTSQELEWMMHSTPSPGIALRPLLITGHSLGSSHSQLAVLNLQKNGVWPDRDISLELFDSPAIRASDVQAFAEKLNSNPLKKSLSINYYVSEGDGVPFAGYLFGSSYLGNNIDLKNIKAAVHKLSLLKEGKQKKAITGLAPHARLYFRGLEDVDYINNRVTIAQYDEETKWQRISVNVARLFAASIAWSLIGTAGGLKRCFFGRRHHDSFISSSRAQ